jgi:hypothetical protein
VRASGGKTFYQRYRDERGRERQVKIGSARWVIPMRLPSSVWLQPSTALLALTFAAKSIRPISLDFDVGFPGRRFFTVPPSIKKRTPADELPGFPISYLDQAIRAGSRGVREG